MRVFSPEVLPRQLSQQLTEVKTYPQISLRQQMLSQVEDGFDITLNVEAIVNVGFAQR